MTEEGTSGTYILRSDLDSQPVAIFKPIDEEQNAPANPRGFIDSFGSPACRDSVLSGEATSRELAAFLLDRDGKAGVPSTTLAQISSDKFENCSN